MKHSLQITVLLLAMFFLTQMIGLIVVNHYNNPEIKQVINDDGTITNKTTYDIPYGLGPPEEMQPQNMWNVIISLIISFTIAVVAILLLMKYKAEIILRLWFFAVVAIAVGITLNSFFSFIPNSAWFVLIISLPLAFLKVFNRNIILHNLTELLIYPGVATVFVVLLLAWTSMPLLAISIILILISLYDMYAVWHAGFMQKMAQYQIQKLRFFTGFFVPYLNKKQRQRYKKLKSSNKNSSKETKFKVNVAILGGGDVVFPIILAGIVLTTLGLLQAIIISLGATLALAGLFLASQKGKFYPAMPFISAGCFIGLGIAYLI